MTTPATMNGLLVRLRERLKDAEENANATNKEFPNSYGGGFENGYVYALQEMIEENHGRDCEYCEAAAAAQGEIEVLREENQGQQVIIERLRAELDYAYRCVSGGYNQGVFDFSVLKDLALSHVAKQNGA